MKAAVLNKTKKKGKHFHTEDLANLTECKQDWCFDSTGAFFSQWVKNIETNEYARPLKADYSEICSVQRAWSTRLKTKHRKSKQNSLNVSMLIIK